MKKHEETPLPPASRARAFAEQHMKGADAIRPDNMALAAGAMISDALTGALTGKEINPACRAGNLAISVARNVNPLDELHMRCKESACEPEETETQKRIRLLEAELEHLKSSA